MRWRLLIVGVTMMLGAAGLAGPALAQAQGPARSTAAAPSSTALFAFNSGLVLNGTSAVSGAKIEASSNHNGPAQRWVLETDGTIRLAANTSLCLDVPAFNYASGVQLDVYTCKGSANQQFTHAAPSASTRVLAIKPTAHPSLCLNVKGGLTANAAVILYACGAATTNYVNEAWATGDLTDVVNKLPSAAGFPLNVAGGGGAGAAAVAWPDRGTLNEYWQTTFVTISGYGEEVTFQPVYNTALCLAPRGGESLRAPLVLASCAGAASQAFATVQLNPASPVTYFIATHDARYCLNYQGGAAQGHPAILYSCVGAPAGNDSWPTSLHMLSGVTMQFGTLGLPDNAGSGPEPVLDVAGTGSGSSAVIDDFNPGFPASQIWTDLQPAGEPEGTPANSDGSISLHPLSDVTLCLTVPGANYVAGQTLSVQTCDGQPDQEFFRLLSPFQRNWMELIPYGDGQLCVHDGAAASSSNRAELEPCDGWYDEAWANSFIGWDEWAGLGATITAYQSSDTLGLTGIGATGGSAVVEGANDSDVSQDWNYHQPLDSDYPAIQSLDNTAWCLGAPGNSPAGTPVSASACDQQADQGFAEMRVQEPGLNYAEQFVWEADPTLCLAQGPASGSGSTSVVLATCSATDTSQAWDLNG
jgi:hypothetical protein